MSKSTMGELEDRYRRLCAILLFLALTREIGDKERHDGAVKKAESGIKSVCEEIERLKKEEAAETRGTKDF